MLSSSEFWAPEAYRAKVKTPLEFVVSAVRASGAQVDDARALLGTLNTMGMPPYGMQPPTGYSMKADAWVNSSALLGRMNSLWAWQPEKYAEFRWTLPNSRRAQRMGSKRSPRSRIRCSPATSRRRPMRRSASNWTIPKSASDDWTMPGVRPTWRRSLD
jgi:uncharacterized protein (DUF1800 family)